MNLRVLGPRVLVRPDKTAEVQTDSGIVKPEQRDAEDVFTGTVIAVGKGHCRHCESPLLESVRVGDAIGYEVQGGQQIDGPNGERYLMLWIEDVMYVARP